MSQTEMENPRSGALTLFLAFVGGALVGGTAALLLAPRTGAETRRRITGAVDETKEVASRVPNAVRQASSAAQAAFTAALKEGAAEDEAPSKRKAS
jgi:gas vesicle protein